MDTGTLFTFLHESLFFIVIFAIFLSFSMVRSTQSLVNFTLGLYLALLISLEFPYYDRILASFGGSPRTEAIVMIVLFIAFAGLATLLFSHLLPTDGGEPAFENFTNKTFFAIGATILVMAYSYHALPITELMEPGTPIQYLFEPQQNFFWWLLVPLVLLFLL